VKEKHQRVEKLTTNSLECFIRDEKKRRELVVAAEKVSLGEI